MRFKLLTGGLALICAAGIPVLPAAAAPVGGEVAITAAPDEASALAAARRSGAPVEVTGLTSETTKVYANPSGTKTVEQHVLPVRARTRDGWAPIDRTLVRDADGTVRPRLAAVGVRLSGGGDGKLATVVKDGKELSLTWPSALPAPRLDGDTATYPSVLPGVDLQVRADFDGFSQVLVVKDAKAAANPALRAIRYGTTAKGVSLKATESATTVAVDEHGSSVFVSGTPTMWDTPERERPMGLHVGKDDLTVLPDVDMLTGRDTKFPLYIDPSYSATQYRWTSVNEYTPGTSYWTSQRTSARVGYQTYDGTSMYRSFFQVNAAPFAGGRVLRTWFAITLDHSGACSATDVAFWQTKPIDPAVALTWTNSKDHWLGGAPLDTRSGNANEAGGCGTTQPDQPMEFSSTAMQNVVQAAATSKASTLTFGFRAPNERSAGQWKKFHPDTAKLVVEYNIAPRPPIGLATVPPTPCGTAVAPTAFNTATPTFSAVASDPDNDNVYGQLEILKDDTLVGYVIGPTIRSGGAFSWPSVPSGLLPENQPTTVFSYRARVRDATLPSTDSRRCYFTVDRTRPNTPVVSSADYPNGVAVKPVGEVGTVTFSKAGADTDVAGFRYGFQQDKTTMWVAANADGTATIPITLWPDGTGAERQLFVRAVDKAGNISVSGPAWNLLAQVRAVPGAPVRSDTNGDRRADIAALFDQGNGRTAAWSFLSAGGGFANGYIGWDTDVSGGFPMYRVRSTNGDFDGDGRTDIAAFREDPDRNVRLYLLRSDSNRFNADGEPAWTGTEYRLSHLTTVAGDFDNDGDDDIAVFQGYTGGQTKMWVHYSNRGVFAPPVLQFEGAVDASQLSAVAGDFDNDGDDDVATFRGTTQTKLWMHYSNGSSFTAPVQQWDSAFNRTKATFTATDVDGTGRDEIVAAVDLGNATTRLTLFTGGTGTWTTSTAWEGPLDAAKAMLAAGDFNADGRGDVATLYDAGGGNRQLYVFASTGAAFADKRMDWQGFVADAPATVFIEPNRRYRLQPKHSDKCAGIVAGGTALQQQNCVSGSTSQQFLLEQIGSTPYYKIKVAGSGKCLEIGSWKHEDNTAVAEFTCDPGGVPQGNQQFRLDYVDGRGMDVVVQPRIVHSDKCVTVTGGSTAAAVAIVQFACGSTPLAHQRFTLRIEP